MPENPLGPIWQHVADVLQGEQRLTAASLKALTVLLDYVRSTLAASHLNPDALDPRTTAWSSTVTTEVLPVIEDVFTTAFERTRRGDDLNASPYATRHLESVWNRLVRVPDEVFDLVRTELEAGRQQGEAIPELADRVDALLTDDQRWTNRAVVIARTEVIGANNSGLYGSAEASARFLGVDAALVVKEWLSTDDDRTRLTHRHAPEGIGGSTVVGLRTAFRVGETELQVPGEPGGAPEEVIQCRCTTLFHFPGDPKYPAALTAAAPPDQQEPTVPDSPTHAGIAVQAGDTKRVLMIQRHIDPTDAPEDMGTWEFPGGSIEDGEDAPTAAWREFSEETGLPAPAGEQTGSWVSPDGIYAGFVHTTPTETDAFPELNPDADAAATPNPDDPDRRTPDVSAWFTLDQIAGMGPAVRPACANNTDWSQFDHEPPQETSMTQPTTETAAVDPTTCTCCGGGGSTGGAGEHACGHECYVCDASGTRDAQAGSSYALEPGDPIVCPGHHGRPDPEPDGEHVPDADSPDAAPAGTPVVPVDDKDKDAALMRVQGASYNTIATDLGYPTPEAARLGAQAAIERLGLAVFRPSATIATHAVPAPGEAPSGGPARADDIAEDGEPWHGILCPEGVTSGDGRRFSLDSVSWRDLPLPLMYQDATLPGHDGAVRVGRIDSIERDGQMIRGAGVWDTSDIAVEAQRQVGVRILRGVSVDCDDVTVELVGSDGQTLDPMVDDFPEDGVVIESASAVRVCGATLCSIPAFHQAYVANGPYVPGEAEPGQDEVDPNHALAASAAWSLVASVAPAVHAADFENPGLQDPTPLTLDDDGRIYGHLAIFGTCHLGIGNECVEPPTSASNYAHFATGFVQTAEGRVAVGPLTMDTGHAPMGLRHRPALAHYDNTGTVVADVAVGQDGLGIWLAGRVRPDLTEAQLYAIRAAGKVSGDWREIGGGLDLIAALIVNVPGFPIARPALAASAASGGSPSAMVACGVVDRPKGGIGSAVIDVEYAPEFAGEVITQVNAFLDRREALSALGARLDAADSNRRGRVFAALTERLDKRGA